MSSVRGEIVMNRIDFASSTASSAANTSSANDFVNKTEITSTLSQAYKFHDAGQGSSHTEHLYSIFTNRPPKPNYSLFASADNEGRVTVKTEDGFTVNFSNKHEEWFITSPDGFKT